MHERSLNVCAIGSCPARRPDLKLITSSSTFSFIIIVGYLPVSIFYPVCLFSYHVQFLGRFGSPFLRFLPAGYHPSRLRSLRMFVF